MLDTFRVLCDTLHMEATPMKDYKIGQDVRHIESGAVGTITQVRLKLRVLFPVSKSVWLSRSDVESV